MKTKISSESTEYDNFLDKEKRKEDQYISTLERFFDEPISTPSIDENKVKRKNTDYQRLFVHFRNVEDLEKFCIRVGQIIPSTVKETYHPLHDPDTALFEEDKTEFKSIDHKILSPKKRILSKTGRKRGANDASIHWKEMPEYEQEDANPFRTVEFRFRKEEHLREFSELVEQPIGDKTKSLWYPKREINDFLSTRWVQKGQNTNPRYPVYIISKGRHESMVTSRSLTRMKIPHYIAIEPQDEANYEEAIDKFGLREYVTLIVLPFSNHGDGPGRARNSCWDHSIELDANRHWVLDDNINDFYRLHQNTRLRVESGAFFAAMEDFCDRYENVKIAGPQYRFFCPSNDAKPPFMTNTRIYSCLLIENDCKHRWRGRYNEDTDICLRVLKDGDCTVQFHAFLQEKMATQTLKGGNTDEFYHKEIGIDENGIAIRADNVDVKGSYNVAGTIAKSQMLVDMHPDVATLVWKFGRWHHHVDYSKFKSNVLKFKERISLKDEPNNYGLELITDWKSEDEI